MAWWCLSLVAAAGTPTLIWTMPISGTVIPHGLAAGDFDADGTTDFLAVVDGDGTYGVAYSVTGTYDAFLPFTDPLPFRVDTLDLDQDGRDSVAFHNPGDEGAGSLFVAAISETKGDPKPGFFLIVEGLNESLFAADFAVADQDRDGTKELIVGVPGVDAVYRVDGTLTGDFQLDELDPDFWQGPPQKDLRGFGAGVAVRDRDGATEAVLARCDVQDGACANAALAVRPLSELDGIVALEDADLVAASAPAPALLSLEVLVDVDGDDIDELVWVGPAEKLVISSDGSATPLSIVASGDDVVTNAGSAGGQVWVEDGGAVYLIDRFREGGAVAEVASDVFRLDGAALGAAIADAGDQDGDGCDDVIASAEETDAVYLLTSPCTPPGTDTGTEDSGTVDSGRDGADVRCQPGLGWACGGRASAVWLAGLAGLLWRRQRTQTAKR